MVVRVRRRLVALLVGAGVAVAAGGVVVAAEHRSPPVSRLVIATGGAGGVFEVYGEGLAGAAGQAFPDADVRVVATAASVQNLRLVASGEADVGFSLADTAGAAAAGQEPFDAPLPVAAIARLYDNYAHLVVRADSPIRRLVDLRGMVVSTGAPDSGTDLFAGRMLGVAGLNPDRDIDRRRLELTESAQALRDGRLDAFFFSGGLPTAAIADLARRATVRLVPLAEWVPALRAAYGELYEERTILASTYRLAGDTLTIGVPNLLVARSDMPDEVAYALTELLFSAKATLVVAHPEAARLNRRAALATYPLPLHPGAARWHQAMKP
jgi:TRAP transporter TAXI family solute receptor